MNSRIKQSNFIFSISIALILLISGCATQLAPEYDKAIVDKTIATSQATMSFLEQIRRGTNVNDYTAREQTYNELIGAYDALSLQAKARPIPKSVALDKINQRLQTKNSETISGDYPSAFAFEKIAETLRKLKEKDQEMNLTAPVIEVFTGQIKIYLDQAITYESFLKR